MSTRWCHQCGSEYVARVEVCPDCGVELRDGAPDGGHGAADADADVGKAPATGPVAVAAGDQVVYELHGWPAEARLQLAQFLESGDESPGDGRVPHAWQGTDLIVPASHQERVEAILDQVEASIEMSAELALDPETPKVAYDISDLDEAALGDVLDTLVEESIRHGYDAYARELVVHEADEQRVEDILEAVDFPDELPPEDDGAGGFSAQEVLSDLFVAADRLRKRSDDPDGVLTMVRAAGTAATMALPYGFAQADWDTIVARARSMRDLLESETVDDESDTTIRDSADDFRTALRPYV